MGFSKLTMALTPAPAAVAMLDEELNWLQAESIIFSASRSEQRVIDTAAAVFVISQQDIKRSGVTSVPEALRMVPGLQVAKVNSNAWAISSRGFNATDSNKLLVMIDGRTVYHPVFSGTLWRTKDVMLDDVERIEVIKGSGATMWGSNAVNGVINVITKKVSDTQGVFVTAGGGSEERAFGSMRYGGQLNDNVDYRAYVKYAKRDDLKSTTSANGNDDWENIQGGFKIDSELTDNDNLTLQGDIYRGNAGNYRSIVSPVAPTSKDGDVGESFSGGNVLSKWSHTVSSTAGYSLQLYFDQTEDETYFSTINDSINTVVRTYDADFQNQFKMQSWLNITWGVGVRHVTTKSNNSVNFSFKTLKRDSTLYSAFIQDELTLMPDTLKFIVGSKFEHNDFSGFEIQPNAKLIFTPDKKQAVWASVSRSVRIPNRLEHDLQSLYLAQVNVAPNVFVVGQGNSHLDSEQLISYELGYRIQPMDTLSFDIAAFYNDYNKLATGISTATPALQTAPNVHFTLPIFADNKGSAETYGVEVVAQWQAMDWWRFQGSYSYLQMQLHSDAGSNVVLPAKPEGESPHHQFSIRSSMDILDDVHLDATVRYVDNLPNQKIASYTEMDINLAWMPIRNLELSVVGQNLLDSQHGEFTSSAFSIPMEVQRGFYGKVSFSY